jgi:hypothetical protein
MTKEIFYFSTGANRKQTKCSKQIGWERADSKPPKRGWAETSKKKKDQSTKGKMQPKH